MTSHRTVANDDAAPERRVVLVSGAGRGIGRGVAVTFARHGCVVGALDLEHGDAHSPYPLSGRKNLLETQSLVRDAGVDCVTGFMDVRSRSQVAKAVDLILGAFGRIDYVVVNAGVTTWHENSWSIPPDDWDRIIETNLTGAWNMAVATIPHLVTSKGAIVFISSTSALKPVRGTGHYSAAKLGMIALMRNLALELASQQVRVNAVLPGGTSSGMVENDIVEEWRQRTPGAVRAGLMTDQRMAPEEIGNAAYWLCSESSRFVTGNVLSVDGGALLL